MDGLPFRVPSIRPEFVYVGLIFALFVFSYLFGLVGTLVAVPLAAAIGVLARFAVHVYLGSSVYKGATAQGGMPVSPGGAP